MNLLRKFSVPIVGLAIMTVLLILAAPRAAHAIVAALVQVVNTTANPAITQDTSKQASQIVTLMCPNTTFVMPCYQMGDKGVPLTLTQYSVPASSYFVMTSLDYFPNGTGTGRAQISVTDNFGAGAHYEDININNTSDETIIQISPGIVMGPGASPVLAIGPGVSNGYYYLHGYLTAI
jgi:hypothetical protein